MSKAKQVASWVVYRITFVGKKPGTNAVCEQKEWDAIQRSQSGNYTLIRSGITNEGEAERLARSTVVEPAAV